MYLVSMETHPFIPWTRAHISCVSLDEYYDIAKSMGKKVKEVDKDAMLEYVQKSGGQIIQRKELPSMQYLLLYVNSATSVSFF